mmetsp:Transcript_80531/g.222773  ORF Transcript_80531/g.222773 Transcript_80531/m.222773 type:complete len:273 (-) Transcript_80531:150-968(-)
MHIAQAIDLHWSRRNRPSANGAGVGSVGRPPPRGSCFCIPCSLVPPDLIGHKVHVWCLLGVLIVFSVLCIGMFEATRLTTHVLRSPCTVLGSEVLDVGTCTLCDDSRPANCEVHPIATARLAVTFKPMHMTENVTGWVWYCKGRAESDPCQQHVKFLDQLSLDARRWEDMRTEYDQRFHAEGPVPCTVGQVYAYMQMHALEGEPKECYYSSRDPKGEDVWLSMPSPGLVDHAWFQKHLEYPVLLALGGLVLLSVLLGCLALEGAELWASGLV